MAAKNISVRTITAATAGLALLAATAAFMPRGDDTDGLVLLDTPYELIVIEDDITVDGVGEMDSLDPSTYAFVGIIIEDDLDWRPDAADALADASELMIIEDDAGWGARTDMLMAAALGSVAALDAVTSSPEVGTAPAARTRSEVARPAARDHRDEQVASLETPRTEMSRGPSQAAITGFAPVQLQQAAPLSADQIRSAIERQLPRVRACYERELKAEQGLAGRMVLAMNVQAGGTVTSASISDDEVGHDELAACVVRAVETFRFPAGTESVAVEYPVNFKASY
jgi:TonB family protein